MHSKAKETSAALSALSLVLELDHPAIQKGKDYLNDNISNGNLTQETGSWALSDVVIALIDLGSGPKISKEVVEKRINRMNQAIAKLKPTFLQTSPNTSTRTLRSKITQIIDDARHEILIVSPFIDMLYEDIVNKILDSKGVVVIKIIARPKSEIKRDRSRIASSALDILNTETKGLLRVTDMVHSRMIIVDSRMMIVSSADLTRDQLYDEFNAGLYTEDPASVRQGIEYFNNLYSLAKPLP